VIYGYLRVSTDKQDENNQKLGVDEKALRMCVHIDEYIVDAGVSGTKEPEKRKLGNLMDKLKPGDTIIASELSRLGRSLYMVMRILEFCMKHEVKVITVKEGYELGDNIQSKVLAFAFSLSAEIERDMISRRTKEALQKKKKDGMILGRPRGSKTGSTKLNAKQNEIERYIETGISYSQMGRMLGVHRMTIQKYCADKGLINLINEKRVELKLTPRAIPNEQNFDDTDILTKIEGGKSYDEIKSDYGINARNNRLNEHIQTSPALYAKYTEVQTKIRIERNGGLKINKQRIQNETH
jgi:DNA invertase Pin-like site-specific DNA recombinase